MDNRSIEYVPEKKTPAWAFLSVILHLAVIGTLVFFTFTRKSLTDILAQKKDRKISSERVRKLSEHIRDINLEQMRDRVRALLMIKDEIDQLTAAANQDYAHFVKDMASANPNEAREKIKNAGEKSKQAADAHQELLKRIQEVRNIQDAAALAAGLKAVQAAANEIDALQTATEETQERVLSAAAWNEINQLAPRQNQLFSRQAAVRQELLALKGKIDNSAWQAGESQKFTNEAAAERQQQKTLTEEKERKQKELDDARAAEAAAWKVFEDKKKEAATCKDAEQKAKKVTGDARNALQQGRDNVKKHEDALKAARSAVQSAQREVRETEKKNNANRQNADKDRNQKRQSLEEKRRNLQTAQQKLDDARKSNNAEQTAAAENQVKQANEHVLQAEKTLQEAEKQAEAKRQEDEKNLTAKRKEADSKQAAEQEAVKKVQAAQTARDQQQQALKKAEDAERQDREKLSQANRVMRDEEKKAQESKRTAERHKREFDNANRKLEQSTQKIADREKRIKDIRDQLNAALPQWQDSVQKLQTQQKEISAEQQAIAAAAEQIKTDGTMPPPQVPVAAPVIDSKQIRELNLATAYTAADNLEAQVVNAYRDIRAIELSMLRELSLESARNNIDTPKPERAAIAADDLIGTPTTGAGLEHQKEAIRTALGETEKMYTYCEDLLNSLRKQQEEDTLQVEQENTPQEMQPMNPEELAKMLEEIKEQLKQETEKAVQKLTQVAELTEIAKTTEKAEKEPTEKADHTADAAVEKITETAAAVKEIATAKDVENIAQKLETISADLKEVAKDDRTAEKLSQQKKEIKPEASAREAAKAAEESAKELAKAAESIKQIAKNMNANMNQQTANNKTRLEKAKTLAQLAVATAEQADVADISALMKAGAQDLSDNSAKRQQLVKRGVPHPKIDEKGMVWGRKIGSAENANTTSNWMSISNWYVIGPWPNPSRANRDRKFPPENAVDLDATYTGIDGKQLSWQYFQMNTDAGRAEIRPYLEREYAIYYFYTEIDSDEERDVWFATGSDDKSKIWINDMLVWESSPVLKGWRIDEGYRKIHLKKGKNKILYRLENGWHAAAMSMGIATGQKPE